MNIQTTTILRRLDWPFNAVGRLEMAWSDEEPLLNKGLFNQSDEDWSIMVLLMARGARALGFRHNHIDTEKRMEKILSDMTDDEIIAEINALRDRRAQARERRVVSAVKPEKKGPEEVTGAAADLLKDILGDL